MSPGTIVGLVTGGGIALAAIILAVLWRFETKALGAERLKEQKVEGDEAELEQRFKAVANELDETRARDEARIKAAEDARRKCEERSDATATVDQLGDELMEPPPWAEDGAK